VAQQLHAGELGRWVSLFFAVTNYVETAECPYYDSNRCNYGLGMARDKEFLKFIHYS
jgi:hypothetical protein